MQTVKKCYGLLYAEALEIYNKYAFEDRKLLTVEIMWEKGDVKVSCNKRLLGQYLFSRLSKGVANKYHKNYFYFILLRTGKGLSIQPNLKVKLVVDMSLGQWKRY